MYLDKKIEKLLENKELIKIYKSLKKDEEVKTLLKSANTAAIGRFGLNDHGKTHAKITVKNSLKLLKFLSKKVKPNIIKEKTGKIKDAKLTVLLSAFLHDIGISVNRKDHETFSVLLAQPIIRRFLYDFYEENEEMISTLLPIILEGIVCHMGKYKPGSVEASIVSVADGCDMVKGRARISFGLQGRDIHEYSSMAINEVNIKKGKPVSIEIKMDSAAGVFQVENQLLKKIENSGLKKYIKVISNVKERGKEFKDIY